MATTQSEQIFSILSNLLGVCDGANYDDGVGFNKPDAGVARYLFRLRQANLWDETSDLIAWQMLQKYHRQHPEIVTIERPSRLIDR